MKLLFLILAHNQPSQTYELARTITEAASDGRAIIHFDASANVSDFELLANSITGAPKIELVKNRVACKWGDFSLVEAVLNALKQERASGSDYDYVVLLSGSCLPCRPIKQLERYLTENYGREFIEAQGEDWIVGGYRKDRYQFYFPFPASPQPSTLEHWMVEAQRLLGIRRSPPDALNVRFGSQWWALTWGMCRKIVSHLERRPDITRFFQKTYIPDEMFFQTIVTNLIDDIKKISGFCLTYYQFTDRGKPIIFYDDCGDYPFSLKYFFFRKTSDEAARLREKSLQHALSEDSGESLHQIGRPNPDYEIACTAQISLPRPGQLFYGDQTRDTPSTVLAATNGDYVVICGPEQLLHRLPSCLDKKYFDVFGRIYAPSKVDFGDESQDYHGLKVNDSELRDFSPALYLARLRRRASNVPVFFWTPADRRGPMQLFAADPKALVVALVPLGNKGEIDWMSFYGDDAGLGEDDARIPGIDQERLEQLAHKMGAEAYPWMSTTQQQNVLMVYVPPEQGQSVKNCDLALEKAMNVCSFRLFPWFGSLMETLKDFLTSNDQRPSVEADK